MTQRDTWSWEIREYGGKTHDQIRCTTGTGDIKADILSWVDWLESMCNTHNFPPGFNQQRVAFANEDVDANPRYAMSASLFGLMVCAEEEMGMQPRLTSAQWRLVTWAGIVRLFEIQTGYSGFPSYLGQLLSHPWIGSFNDLRNIMALICGDDGRWPRKHTYYIRLTRDWIQKRWFNQQVQIDEVYA